MPPSLYSPLAPVPGLSLPDHSGQSPPRGLPASLSPRRNPGNCRPPSRCLCACVCLAGGGGLARWGLETHKLHWLQKVAPYYTLPPAERATARQSGTSSTGGCDSERRWGQSGEQLPSSLTHSLSDYPSLQDTLWIRRTGPAAIHP